MPLLKLLFLVLLILNALALAAGMGWLGSSAPRGEPERLTNQINPQLIRLEEATGVAPGPANAETVIPPAQTLPAPAPAPSPPAAPTPAPSAPAPLTVDPAPRVTMLPEVATIASPPMTCSAFTGLSESLAGRIQRLARDTDAPVETSLTLIEAASGWWVRVPPANSRQAADQRAQELRQIGVSDLFVVREAGPEQHAISLGLFRTEAAAGQHLVDLQRLGVTGAEITARTPATYRLEITAPQDTLQDILARLPAAARPASREACRQ